MRIEARKIFRTPKVFEVSSEGLCLSGHIIHKQGGLFCLEGRLVGEILLICDRSGEEFLHKVDEDLVLYISDGFWDTQSQRFESLDIIEFFDGFIDLDYILRSEIESIRLGYHTKEGEKDYGST